MYGRNNAGSNFIMTCDIRSEFIIVYLVSDFDTVKFAERICFFDKSSFKHFQFRLFMVYNLKLVLCVAVVTFFLSFTLCHSGAIELMTTFERKAKKALSVTECTMRIIIIVACIFRI